MATREEEDRGTGEGLAEEGQASSSLVAKGEDRVGRREQREDTQSSRWSGRQAGREGTGQGFEKTQKGRGQLGPKLGVWLVGTQFQGWRHMP